MEVGSKKEAPQNTEVGSKKEAPRNTEVGSKKEGPSAGGFDLHTSAKEKGSLSRNIQVLRRSKSTADRCSG